ncbi:putative membrane spanning protein (plasmid) [Roseomonas mucosa]|uniref:Uncharacterized protein n=2 Tax=Roseomonas TaxID=125216 RepID=A0A379PMG8_9PROT|nr:putative membrane spanning protein [Roseomonas mucosa]QDD97306.1 putative membrane spanning protein [Roseomonas mucosa]SUE95462.1 Uncharacterised protein [Roseomonas mucosa]
MDTHLVAHPDFRPLTADAPGPAGPSSPGAPQEPPQRPSEAISPAKPAPRARRRSRLLGGVALGAVLLLAGGAFLASPYNTIYPLDLRRVSASLQGAMEGARQVIAPHGPELVAPSARIAAGPAPVSVPPVERERHRPAPPQQQLQEIVGFQANPARPAPATAEGNLPTPAASPPARRIVEPTPLAPRIGEVPARPPVATGGTPPEVTTPRPAMVTAPADPAPIQTPPTAVIPSVTTSTPAATAAAEPPPAAVASAAPPARAAGVVTTPAPLTVIPVPAPATVASQFATPDPVTVAAGLRPAPMSTPQQVEVLGLVTTIGTMVRDLREENRQLRADMAAARERLDAATADLSRRVALAEARGSVAAAMGSPVPPAPMPLAAAPAPAPPVTAAASRTPAPSDTVRRRYRVQAASPGLAMLSEVDNTGESGTQLQVAVGDRVPGYGRITAIAQQGATWVVRAERGSIQ